LAFVRTVTPPILAVFRPATVAAAAPEAAAAALPVADALVAGALLGALLDELLLELHAARAARPAATAGTTSSPRRRRLGIFSLSCEVIMSFPPFLVGYPPFSLRYGELGLARNDADEPALQSTVRAALGAALRGARGGLCAALTVVHASALEPRVTRDLQLPFA
jgi:hypothetical protein